MLTIRPTSKVAVSPEGRVHVCSRLFKIFQDWCLFGGFHATVGWSWFHLKKSSAVFGDVLVRVIVRGYAVGQVSISYGQCLCSLLTESSVEFVACSWWALINSTEICGHIVVRPYKFHRLGLFTLDFWSRHLHPWNSWTPLEVITIVYCWRTTA